MIAYHRIRDCKFLAQARSRDRWTTRILGKFDIDSPGRSFVSFSPHKMSLDDIDGNVRVSGRTSEGAS